MLATSENIETIRQLLRIDDDSEVTCNILSVYTASAEEWLKNTGVTVDYSNGQIMDIVSLYVGKRYDDPEGTGTGNAELSLAALAEQVRLSQAVAAEAAAEEPAADPPPGEPPADEPVTEEPGTEEPGTGEPDADEPGADEPGADEPAPEPEAPEEPAESGDEA